MSMQHIPEQPLPIPFDRAGSVWERLDRIEEKLDTLIAALAEDDEQEPSTTLDGDEAGGERDTTQSL